MIPALIGSKQLFAMAGIHLAYNSFRRIAGVRRKNRFVKRVPMVFEFKESDKCEDKQQYKRREKSFDLKEWREHR